jgi:hypothetical protein
MARLHTRRVVLFGVFITSVLVTLSIYKTQHVTSKEQQPLSVTDCRSSDSCASKSTIVLPFRAMGASVDPLSSRLIEAEVVQPTLSIYQRVLKMVTSKYEMENEDNGIEQRAVSSVSRDFLRPLLKDMQPTETVAPSAYDKRVISLNCTDSNRCTPPLLRSDGFVRNCISGDIIGKVPLHMVTAPVKLRKWKVVESSHSRQRSFKKVFDSRAWGHSWDAQYKGLNASGSSSIVQLV